MLLQIRQLHTRFFTSAGVVSAVAGVDLDVPRGRTVALVGESGSGKSVTALSVLRLVAPPGRIVSGQILFEGRDLLALSEREMRAVRGDRVAMIFQEPMTSLNPVLSVGEQVAEALRLHRGVKGRAARGRVVELFERVGIRDATARYEAYPHQMSGGMRQRVMIAMALACEPALLIADEPTTALDVTIQAQILELLRQLQNETGLAILFITHDLGVVAEIAHQVGVMYAGRIVESGPVRQVLTNPRHPYTQALLRCLPAAPPLSGALGSSPISKRLEMIAGEAPDLLRPPGGCPFHPRCPLGQNDAQCRTQEPELAEVAAEHVCACWKAKLKVLG